MIELIISSRESQIFNGKINKVSLKTNNGVEVFMYESSPQINYIEDIDQEIQVSYDNKIHLFKINTAIIHFKDNVLKILVDKE